MREEFNLDSVLFYCKAFRKRLELSRRKEGERLDYVSRFPLHSCLHFLLSSVHLRQQDRAQSRVPNLLNNILSSYLCI